MQEPSSISDRATRNVFLMLCGVGLFAIMSSTMSKSPVLPLFARHLGVTNAILGLVAAASTVVGIIVSLPAGALSDIIGRRRVLIAALVVFASAPFLYLLVHSAGALVMVRVYHGLATAIFGPVAMAYVADLARVRRAESMGWYSSSTLVGRSIAPMVGGLLLSLPLLVESNFNYQAVYLACGVAGVIALILGFFLPRPAVAPAGEGNAQQGSQVREQLKSMAESLRVVGRNRTILVTSIVEAMQYLAYGAVETFLPLYALQHGVTKWQIGLIFGAQILILALTKPFSGRTADRVGRRPMIAAGLFLNGLALLGLTLYPSFWGFFVGAALFGLAMSVVTASTSALVADESRAAHYGTSLGVLSTIMDMGHASGPIIAGVVIGSLQYSGTYRALGGLMVVAMLLFLVAIPARRRPEEHESV